MAPHSSTLAWKIPWVEEPGGLQSMGSLESGTTERLHFHFSLSCIGQGNGHPLQCSCLENPGDRGAWWAAVHGVTQSWTRLKWLSSSSSIAYMDHLCRPQYDLTLKFLVTGNYPQTYFLSKSACMYLRVWKGAVKHVLFYFFSSIMYSFPDFKVRF